MSNNLNNIDDRDMVNSRIEALARKAFSAAYKEALDSEEGVAAVVGDALYQVYKDGTKVKIKDIPAGFTVDTNMQYRLEA